MRLFKPQYKLHYLLLMVFVSSVLLTLLTVLVLIPSLSAMYSGHTEASSSDTEEIYSPSFLRAEEVVILEEETLDGPKEVVLPVDKVLFEYIEVTDSCGPHFGDECVRMREGPGTDFPVVSRLRNGMVLKVSGKVERNGATWYKIASDEEIRYPERITSDWYVVSDYVTVLLDEGDKTIWTHEYATTSDKSILVDRSEQKLYAYEGEELFMETFISTGLELTPTPRGTFTVFKKTPSRYMQGPLPGIPGNQYYDLPGVPWNLYFTQGGAVIHGAYWHDSFGSRYSHGCVNLSPEDARKLYEWARLGTKVIVQD